LVDIRLLIQILTKKNIDKRVENENLRSLVSKMDFLSEDKKRRSTRTRTPKRKFVEEEDCDGIGKKSYSKKARKVFTKRS